MKVLGLVGSYTRCGNTEVAVKEALMEVEEEGVDVDILRLTDYEIQSCRGCGVCGAKQIRCPIPDDLNPLLDRIFEADGVILGAPCYILGTTAIVKQILDRMISYSPITAFNKARGKPAGIIVPYGGRGYISYAFVNPNIFIQTSLGMEVVDRCALNCSGHNELVLDERQLNRARKIGRSVGKAVKTGGMTYQGEIGVCPLCHDRVLGILKNSDAVECATCGIRGKLTLIDNKIKVIFKEEDILRRRWTPEDWGTHMLYHGVGIGTLNAMIMEEGAEKKKKYKDYLNIGGVSEASSEAE